MIKRQRLAAATALVCMILSLGGLGRHAHAWEGSVAPTMQAPGTIQNAFVGIQYYTRDYITPEGHVILGVMSVYGSAIQSAAWGLAFGAPAGIFAGAIVGL